MDGIYKPITTEAGHFARMAAVSGGFAINITHIAVGSSGYDVPKNHFGRSTATGLRAEKDRVEIQDARVISPNQKDISFSIEPDSEYYTREIGLYLEDGTLYAVASHPTISLDWASPQSLTLIAIELVIDDGDADSLTVTSSGPPLNLLMTKEIATLSAFCVNNALESLRLADRIRKTTGEY